MQYRQIKQKDGEFDHHWNSLSSFKSSSEWSFSIRDFTMFVSFLSSSRAIVKAYKAFAFSPNFLYILPFYTKMGDSLGAKTFSSSKTSKLLSLPISSGNTRILFPKLQKYYSPVVLMCHSLWTSASMPLTVVRWVWMCSSVEPALN